MRVVAELAQFAGAEDLAGAGLAQVDGGVRMEAKARCHLLFHLGDLAVEGCDDHRQGAGGGGVDGGNRLRLAAAGAQRGQEGIGLAGDVAATGALERSGHLRPGQPGGPGGLGA